MSAGGESSIHRGLTIAEIQATLARLWADSLDTVLARIAVLETLAASISAGSESAEAIATGQMEAHKLAGLLGTFGLGDASELAASIDRGLEAPQPDGVALAELASSLRSAVTGSTLPGSDPFPAGGRGSEP